MLAVLWNAESAILITQPGTSQCTNFWISKLNIKETPLFQRKTTRSQKPSGHQLRTSCHTDAVKPPSTESTLEKCLQTQSDPFWEMPFILFRHVPEPSQSTILNHNHMNPFSKSLETLAFRQPNTEITSLKCANWPLKETSLGFSAMRSNTSSNAPLPPRSFY